MNYMKSMDKNQVNFNKFEILRMINLIEEKINELTEDYNKEQNEKFKIHIGEYIKNLKETHAKMQKWYEKLQLEDIENNSKEEINSQEKEKEKEIVLNTISEVVNLMKNPCSFRKFMENLGLTSKDYEALYNAGGMYLVDISNYLDENNIDR